MSATPDYFVAPFSPDGEMIGVARRTIADLSPKWLQFCHDLLASNGPVFCCEIPLPPLKHISLQITSGSGTALVSFSVRQQPFSSAIALTGQNPSAEAEIMRMFIDSMRRVPFVQQAAASSAPFESIRKLSDRPLYAVILWANPQISEQDQELVNQLEQHLAAALLTPPSTTP